MTAARPGSDEILLESQRPEFQIFFMLANAWFIGTHGIALQDFREVYPYEVYEHLVHQPDRPESAGRFGIRDGKPVVAFDRSVIRELTRAESLEVVAYATVSLQYHELFHYKLFLMNGKNWDAVPRGDWIEGVVESLARDATLRFREWFESPARHEAIAKSAAIIKAGLG